METPASAYRPSPRPFTDRPKPLEYPPHSDIRQVSGDNTLRWKNRKVLVSGLLKHKTVGLEQTADGVWSIFLGPLPLGWLDEADYRITDVQDRARRRR